MNLKTILAIMPLAAICFLAVCEKKGPAEKFGEKVDEAIEEAQDKVKEATE